MFLSTRTCLALATIFVGVAASSAQQVRPDALGTSRTIDINVHVTSSSKIPVGKLLKADFALMDDKTPQTITSFKTSAEQDSLNVILLIDAVNTGFENVAYVREEVQKFLRANGGHLAHPATIAVLTDKGTQLEKGFSTDGNMLSASLDHYTVGLREITRSTGIWGADERVQISLAAVRELSAYAATLPGQKMVLWVSPGWPLLSGARVQLDLKQQRQIFSDVVTFSTQLRQAGVTFYSINPLGPEESVFRADYYKEFVKGVSTSEQTDLADLSLQVLSAQSGGLVFNGSSDVTGMLKQCFVDMDSSYEITFDAPAAERPNEYHHISVTVDKPGLTARTRDGYYAQP